MGQARLAELLGYAVKGVPNRSHISSLIRKLEGLGYLSNLGQRGYNKTNLYRLSVPKHGVFRGAAFRQVPDAEYQSSRELLGLKQQGYGSVEELIAEIERD